jgi:D-glycero-D-manno-heptose 1,7-bisphosphate phosphatase
MVGPQKWVILDRDGVINADSDAYIKSVAEWLPLPGSLEAIAMLTAAGFAVAVATNQSGVGRGLFSRAELERIHDAMRAAVSAAGGQLAGIYVCPHRPSEGCDCRKPAPGLLRQIERDSGGSLRGVPFIGDKLSDITAARVVGARPILVQTGQGRATQAALGAAAVEIYPDLKAAALALVSERAS